MSKLPVLSKIRSEDIKDAPQWIQPVIGILNRFMEVVWTSLSSSLTFEDNIKSQEHNAKLSSSDMPYSFKKDINTKVKGVLLLEVNPENGSTLPNAITPQWSEVGSQIRVNLIGLPATKCNVRMLIL